MPSIVVAAYLIGAVPIGYLVARLRGVDIFQQGSGNIGATNIARILGFRLGLLVFALDFAKGALPTAWSLQVPGIADEPDLLPVAAGLAAFLGHLFPVYLGFRGGKGVATGAGVVAVLLPGPALAGLIAWITVLCAFRFVSLASVCAAVTLCLARLALSPEPFAPAHLILTLFCVCACLLVIWKHRANLRRLRKGEENSLSPEGAMQPICKTVHVMAVGMWFGMSVFFSFFVALSLFGSFEALAQNSDRPTWFPLPSAFQSEPAMQKDQGTRAAGFAISPLFDYYFIVQGVCGLLAAGTALGWSRAANGRRIDGVRFLVVVLGLALVIVGWPLERKVSALRQTRNAAADRFLETNPASGSASEAQAAWDAAKKEFVAWHLCSLLLNLVTIVMVTLAMALAAHLPAGLVASKKNAPPSPAPAVVTQV